MLVGPQNGCWIAVRLPLRAPPRLMVNLDKTRRPAWRIESMPPLSISPSSTTSRRNVAATLRARR